MVHDDDHDYYDDVDDDDDDDDGDEDGGGGHGDDDGQRHHYSPTCNCALIPCWSLMLFLIMVPEYARDLGALASRNSPDSSMLVSLGSGVSYNSGKWW